MVAELKHGDELRLLLPPRTYGRGQLSFAPIGRGQKRTAATDKMGAVVQQAIIAHRIGGESRRSIALRTSYSEREVQSWLTGTTWPAYSAPVLERLADLGIGRHRGERRFHGGQRYREIIAAQADLLSRLVWLFRHDPRPEVVRALEDARLLTEYGTTSP